MKIRELLSIVKDTANKNGLSKPYIVGGLPRDIYLGKLKSVADIDMTCGNKDSLEIGRLLVRNLEGAVLNEYNDGHSRLTYGGYFIDFSNNFVVNSIDTILLGMGISKPNNMMRELYSRDFTINTLLMPLDLSNIIDLTGKGLTNMKSGIIDTCLTPKLTLGSDPKRIARIIYLCAKLGFKPSDRVAFWVSKNGNLMNNDDILTYNKLKINKAFSYNEKYTAKLITDMNLWKYIPESETTLKYIAKRPNAI